MNLSQRITSARAAALALAAAFLLAACGGGSSGSAPVVETPTATTGTFGLLFTDKPTDEFSAIKLNVVQAILIGGGDGQQVLFEGSEPIDLLDLTNFSEPVIFGEVEAGKYTKLRLFIDSLELVPLDGGPSIFPRLPANGKIDLLDQDGFDVLPGRTLLAEVDMDANKSIKITSAGNSKKYNFRPVVKVKFSDGGIQGKLARVDGIVSDPLDPTGSFVLCDIETPDSCVDVVTGDSTSFFDITGLPTDFAGVTVQAPVVVIGRYEVGTDVVLNAIVVEVGGTAEQIKGFVSDPMPENFVLVAEDKPDLTVLLQTNTKYFDAFGEIAADAIVLGAAVEVEGVMLEKASPADPDVIRAALVFVEADDDDQISGTINSNITDSAFELLLSDLSTTVNVTVLGDADILLVNETDSEVTIGDITSLASGQSVELFGTSPGGGLFNASEIIVLVDSSGT